MMVVFSTFLITAVQAYNGAQSVENEYKQLFTSFGANRLQYYIKAIIPSSLIWVLTSLKITVGFALLGAFIGEFISSENGLGRLIIKAGSLYNMPLVIVGLLHIIIIALFLNYLVDQLEKYFIKRKYKIIDN